MTTLDKNTRGKAAQHLFQKGVIEAFSYFQKKCFTSTVYQLQNSHDGVTDYAFGRLTNTKRNYPKHKLEIFP